MNPIKLSLTQEQCQQLANCLNIAIRAGGVDVAKQCMWFISDMENELSKPDLAMVPDSLSQ